MSSQVLVSGVSWSLWQVKAPHGAGAGGMCVPAAAKVCFPVLLHYFSGAEGVLDVPDQAVSSRLSWRTPYRFHSGNGLSNQESMLHQSLFQTQGCLSEPKTLPQSYVQFFSSHFLVISKTFFASSLYIPLF